MGHSNQIGAIEVGCLFKGVQKLSSVTAARCTHRESLFFGQVEPFANHPGVYALLNIPVRLLQQLADQQDHRRRPVADLLILCHGRPGNHGRCRVLDLHFRQEDFTVLLNQCGRVTSSPWSF